MTTNYLKEHSYFVLYDMNDNVVCYLHDYSELPNILPNYRLSDITRNFNKSDGFIQVVCDKSFYKLYRFEE